MLQDTSPPDLHGRAVDLRGTVPGKGTRARCPNAIERLPRSTLRAFGAANIPRTAKR